MALGTPFKSPNDKSCRQQSFMVSTKGADSPTTFTSPKTMTLPQSVRHFISYLRRYMLEKKIKTFIATRGLSKTMEKTEAVATAKVITTVSWDTLNQEVQHETSEHRSLMETIRKLNQSRKELISLAGYDDSILIPSFTFLTLGALMTSIIPHYYGVCVHLLATAQSTTRVQIIRALTGLAVSSIAGAFFTGCRGGLFWLAGSRGNYNVRIKLHRNLLLQEAAFFDSVETGTLLSRLNNDVNKIGMVVSFHVNVVLRQTAQLIFGSIYLMRISLSLSLVSFLGIAMVAYISALYGNFARVLAERVQNTFADATAVAESSFSMSETVRAFDGVSCESDKYEQAQFRALQLEEVQAWAYGSHKFVSDTLQAALQGWLLFLCWTLGRSGGLPLAKLTTFMFYVNFVLESSNEVGDQWAKIQGAIGASSSVFDLIRRIPKVRDPQVTYGSISSSMTPTNGQDIAVYPTNGHSLNGFVESHPLIEFSNVTMSYEALESPALSTINLQIYSGDRVAIVGRSGSGKSSMLRALLRFYDPSTGEIKIGNTNLRQLTRAELARRVAVVEQEPHLFPASLIDNVLYGIEKDYLDSQSGCMQYSESVRMKVAEALELAGLPVHGSNKNDLGLELDTRVGEGGRMLSGGQRQRVAIARALFREPDVLLLDEPTSALDSKSEKTVVKALKNAMEKTKCMLMVTHRLGVIRSLDVNKVVVLERGEVVEMGNPETLLHSGGAYAQLAREQGIIALEPKKEVRL